ncbi:MAG: DNA-deoxyinosine glycosylase [Pseudomonadota bacterium]
MTAAAHDRGFPPVAQPDATVLILGSLPGRKSLELRQYYAHPQNAFWKIMAELFGGASSLPYTQRLKTLTANRIALWDVLAAAERPGSLDSAIVPHSAVPNDFAEFFRAHPRIRRVYFNGQKAHGLFQRRVLPALGQEFAGIHFECLPSTSPAHAGMTFAKKLDRWTRIKETMK